MTDAYYANKYQIDSVVDDWLNGTLQPSSKDINAYEAHYSHAKWGRDLPVRARTGFHKFYSNPNKLPVDHLGNIHKFNDTEIVGPAPGKFSIKNRGMDLTNNAHLTDLVTMAPNRTIANKTGPINPNISSSKKVGLNGGISAIKSIQPTGGATTTTSSGSGTGKLSVSKPKSSVKGGIGSLGTGKTAVQNAGKMSGSGNKGKAPSKSVGKASGPANKASNKPGGTKSFGTKSGGSIKSGGTKSGGSSGSGNKSFGSTSIKDSTKSGGK